MSKKLKKFREEQKESFLLEEELKALVYFLPGIDAKKYMLGFMSAFLERYFKADYKYFMDIKEGRAEESLQDFIKHHEELIERIKAAIAEEEKAN